MKNRKTVAIRLIVNTKVSIKREQNFHFPKYNACNLWIIIVQVIFERVQGNMMQSTEPTLLESQVATSGSTETEKFSNLRTFRSHGIIATFGYWKKKDTLTIVRHD